MNFETKLQNYANLLIRSGCNLQAGQELFLRCPICCAPFARMLVKAAYEAGARDVTMSWSDDQISRLRFENSPLEVFETVPEWFAKLHNDSAARGVALLTISSQDPEALAGVDPHKPAALIKANHKALKPSYDALDMGRNVWCIAAAPNPIWAQKVFPGCSEEEAVDKLWESIFQAVRVNTPDPIQAWEEHRKSFEARRAWLDSQKFDRLHYHNSIGTDITIGLLANHNWEGGGAKTVGGTYYFPNMPTEEIFCSPDRNRADGTVHSAMPLIYNGNIIDDFSLTFANGKVVSFTAKTGYDTLKEIINTDEGAAHLGEVALIPCTSPLAEMNLLFYNTLYDENASCHFAIGKGFPESIPGGVEMDEDTLTQAGLNHSAVHVDFMLGTPDLSITGFQADGTEVAIFRDGKWAF